VSGQLHTYATLTPGGRTPGTHWIGGWMSPEDGLNDKEKRKFLILPGLELRPSVIQPIASRYANYAKVAPSTVIKYMDKLNIFVLGVDFLAIVQIMKFLYLF
jgi:hypothetical protein